MLVIILLQVLYGTSTCPSLCGRAVNSGEFRLVVVVIVVMVVISGGRSDE